MLNLAENVLKQSAVPWTSVPPELRPQQQVEWSRINRRGSAATTFLEGPVLAPDGTLYCVDIPNGRILRVDPTGHWEVACAYDGWPNGMAMAPDGRMLVADARRGLVRLDLRTGGVEMLLTHAVTQGFLGINDLQLTADGAVWFTDQGQTGLHDPAGRVYRWQGGELRCILDRLPSPNGLRVSADGGELFVAVTRDNAVWRAPLTASGQPTRLGRFASFYGPVGPDGIHIDAAGRLWVCLPGADAVWVLNRKAEAIARYHFPDGAFPSNIAMDAAGQRIVVTCSGAEALFTLPALA
ncbi:SMP-30/gluconolactonase/LRE family protein [Ramlibacter sp. G-1-2-2]|uniref:SMP-30/gluconolactonase/LRE family protein n=1 Tax=Ramlibacter agri TaxID=2728837 RepID=A0A848GZM9_9BURK|nr:SMP-30/gluconolactonase/LRE family protein [Ramlibacter agri]NML44156.1 SMP-30/gluconolactonase/LRE family protein [Ramlibacter agri]